MAPETLTKTLAGLLEARQYRALREAFSEMNPVDLARFIETLSRDHATVAFRTLPKEAEMEVFAELDLSRNRRIEVPGPLGTTVVAVEKGRVRVVSDPGPHQYCVRQGWLERAGQIAICAPNEVSVQIAGGRGTYDSLSY